MLNSNNEFATLLEGLKCTGVRQAGGLQIFDLKSQDPTQAVEYRTLDEAVAENLITITEVSADGRVPSLHVINRSTEKVFLMAGELLVGCKQDRVLNTSLMVPAQIEMDIPVTCVEAGRWGYRSQTFRSSGSSSHSTLRMAMLAQSHSHYRARGMPGSDQSEVWQEVARKLGATQSHSATNTLDAVYQNYMNRLEAILSQMPVEPGANGAVFVLDGQIIGCDIFDKASTLKKLWPKLLKSYAIDALESSKDHYASLQPESVLAWLKAAVTVVPEKFESPGLGSDIRLQGDQIVGAVLVVNQHPVHVELFHK